MITGAFSSATPLCPPSEQLRDLAEQFAVSQDLDSLGATATCLLLADLVEQGWGAESARDCLWVTPPNFRQHPGSDPLTEKQRVRESLQLARDRQLREPSVQAFFRRMESVRMHKGQQVSVLSLFDDGEDLAAVLSDTALSAPDQQLARLGEIVSPAIEIVEAGAICPETGLPLMDIWRYARHTWSLEYRPTPGRAVLFLLRNRARPFSPLMGIGALASAVPQLSVRDAWIGWTPKSFLEAAAADTKTWPRQLAALLRVLEQARKGIRADDLELALGGLTGDQVEQKLVAMSEDAASRRAKGLLERSVTAGNASEPASPKRLPTTAKGTVDWLTASSAPLFVRKRAATLARVLFALRVLSNAPTTFAEFRSEVEHDTDLARALSIALREVRKVGMASRILDLNVCGAVPPYGDLLVGKLVALAAASKEIVDACRERYDNTVSVIASQMAGRAVKRTPHVLTVTTTSLYAQSASQYNRLRLNVPHCQSTTRLQWHELGVTKGYGTVHLGRDTFRALRRYSIMKRGARSVNNVFGEGGSPRLRQVREALDDLSLDSDALLRHWTPRRVYGLELYDGSNAALRIGKLATGPLLPFDSIAGAWAIRWLRARGLRKDVRDRVRMLSATTVRTGLKPMERHRSRSTVRRVPVPAQSLTNRDIDMTSIGRPALVQSLYRAIASCADHHDAQTVEALHIATPVEGFVLSKATSGNVVFVTGNPGDGKTHLIRHMLPELERFGVDVCLDANERDYSELEALVERTLSLPTSGCVIAINQGILVELLIYCKEKGWAQEAREQLLHPLTYEPRSWEPVRGPTSTTNHERVEVVDLNLRNHLSKDIVLSALGRILALSSPCDGCLAACGSQLNVPRLSSPLVAERLAGLLERLSRGGFHATMRDLQACLAYLIYSGRECEEIKKEYSVSVPYWEACFVGGEGALFDKLREFDPITHPDPVLDDLLWRCVETLDAWSLQYESIRRGDELLDVRMRDYMGLKRRALFEHRDGEGLLRSIGGPVDQLLLELFEGARNLVPRLTRLLNRFYDRDEEREDTLFLWTTHGYDARPARFAAAVASVPSNDLRLLVPVLGAGRREAFPGYHPDHAILRHKEDSDAEGLIVDRALVEALLFSDDGLPTAFRRGEVEARIASFLDRLSRRAWGTIGDGVLRVRLVAMETGRNGDVRVDMQSREYVSE